MGTAGRVETVGGAAALGGREGGLAMAEMVEREGEPGALVT